jgi:hypothetical protein
MKFGYRHSDPEGVRRQALRVILCVAVLQCCGFGVTGNTAKQHNGSTTINHLRLTRSRNFACLPVGRDFVLRIQGLDDAFHC